VPVTGKVSLSASDAGRSEPLPLQPTELALCQGAGTVGVSLQLATPTEICAALAGTTTCSQAVRVQPGAAAVISVTARSPSPVPNWSPVGQVGQPFTLTLAVLDRYRNVVPGYTGTVRCERLALEI